MIINEIQYLGSEMTLPISITDDGFDQDVDAWSVACMVGRLEVNCTKIHASNGNWYFLLDTSQLKSGVCCVVVEYDVPDVAYTDGLRHVIWKKDLCYLKDV